MSTQQVNLSFLATDEPITLDMLDAAPLLIKVREIFKDLYIGQGVTYKVFVNTALRLLSAVKINYKLLDKSVGLVVAAYHRIRDVLLGHRAAIIAALSRKGSFGLGDANQLLHLCEGREFRGTSDFEIENPDEDTYQFIADCANRFELFTENITGPQLIAFDDGNLSKPFVAKNIAHAAFFFSLLANMKMWPRNWKHQIVSNRLLLSSMKKQPPTIEYLTTVCQKNDAKTYLAAIEPKFKTTSGKFYNRITAEVKFAVLKT